ncbi:hypothetical protein BU15DRAFT_67130 [Melanogaster broomeanus]|nr:hypothetical protein BU15DRAFT_67130 [Melanogaster broomeanus]
MSQASDLHSILASLQLKDYTSVVVVTVVVYDFTNTLTLPKDETLVLGVYDVHFHRSELTLITGTVFYLLVNWTLVVFLGVVNGPKITVLLVLMILRIYAMYNRSRRILVILLVIYIPNLVNLAVTTAIYNTPTTYVSDSTDSSVLASFPVTNLEVVDAKFCVMAYQATFLETILRFMPQFILSTLLCSLAVGQLVRESLQMHQAVKRWRSNRYLELFARESILFLSVNLFYCVTFLLNQFGSGSEANPTLLGLISYIFPYVLAPRFVISVRELHSNMVGRHVDTGFGVVSQCISTNHNIVFMSAGEILAHGTDLVAGPGTTGQAADGVVWELVIKVEGSHQLAVLSEGVASEPTFDI